MGDAIDRDWPDDDQDDQDYPLPNDRGFVKPIEPHDLRQDDIGTSWDRQPNDFQSPQGFRRDIFSTLENEVFSH